MSVNSYDSESIAERVSLESDPPQKSRRSMATQARSGHLMHVGRDIAAAEIESLQKSGRRAVRPQVNPSPEMASQYDSGAIAERVSMGANGPQKSRRSMATQARSGHLMHGGHDITAEEIESLQKSGRRAVRPQVNPSPETRGKD